MGTTGHKSEPSIHSYAKKCPAMKTRQMSYALATDFIKNPKTPKKTKQHSLHLFQHQKKVIKMTLTHQLSLFDLLADFQEDDDISNEEILKC